jgi:hypothetical protein
MDKKVGKECIWFICFDEIGASASIHAKFKKDAEVSHKVSRYINRGYDELTAKERAGFSLVLGIMARFLVLKNSFGFCCGKSSFLFQQAMGVESILSPVCVKHLTLGPLSVSFCTIVSIFLFLILMEIFFFFFLSKG